MDRRVSTAEVGQNLNAILHGVEEAESFVITSEGQDVARVSPVEQFDVNSEKAKQARKELFERLAKTEAIDIGPWARAELYEDGE
jgi:antitoxin (DNA-binding transcriptional repressor) of toxin-antitoxin stability system